MIRNYVRRLLWLALGMLVSAIGIVMMLVFLAFLKTKGDKVS